MFYPIMIYPVLASKHGYRNVTFSNRDVSYKKETNDYSEKVLISAAWIAIAGITANIIYRNIKEPKLNNIDVNNLKKEITDLKRKLRNNFEEKKKYRLKSEKYSLFRKRVLELLKDKEYIKINGTIKKEVNKTIKNPDIIPKNYTAERIHLDDIETYKPLLKYKEFIYDVLAGMIEPKVKFEKKYGISLELAKEFVKKYFYCEPKEFTRDLRNVPKNKLPNPNHSLKEDLLEILQKKANEKAITDMRQSEDVIKLKELNRKLNEIVK